MKQETNARRQQGLLGAWKGRIGAVFQQHLAQLGDVVICATVSNRADGPGVAP